MLSEFVRFTNWIFTHYTSEEFRLKVWMGIGTVFFGLICIIFLTMAMGAILKGKEKAPAAAAAAPAAAPAPAPKPQGMQPEIVAAITAALSEEVGISSRSMNIVNIKKI